MKKKNLKENTNELIGQVEQEQIEQNKIELIGQVGQEQIDAWKHTHTTGVFALIVGGHVCYCKKPSRLEIAVAHASYANNNIGYSEYILNQVFLGGSEEIKTNDDLFFNIIPDLSRLIESYKTDLKKL